MNRCSLHHITTNEMYRIGNNRHEPTKMNFVLIMMTMSLYFDANSFFILKRFFVSKLYIFQILLLYLCSFVTLYIKYIWFYLLFMPEMSSKRGFYFRCCINFLTGDDFLLLLMDSWVHFVLYPVLINY